MGRIKVCVITADRFRQIGLSHVLAQDSDLLVIDHGELRDELEIVTRFQPHVVVLEMRPGQPELPAFLRECRHASPQTSVLLVGAEGGDEVSAFRIGVKGYLDILHFPDEIVAAVKAIHRGHAWMARRTMGRLIDEIATEIDHGQERRKASLLTTAQRRVLQLLARDGLTNKEIAAQLGIEERTVEYHITRLLQRFRVTNRNQLIIHAIRGRIVSL